MFVQTDRDITLQSFSHRWPQNEKDSFPLRKTKTRLQVYRHFLTIHRKTSVTKPSVCKLHQREAPVSGPYDSVSAALWAEY